MSSSVRGGLNCPSPHPLLAEIESRISEGCSDVEHYRDLYTDPGKIDDMVNQILVHKRGYFIRQVKWPLRKALEGFHNFSWWRKLLVLREMLKLVRRYPEPTFENTKSANTHPTLRIIEKFNRYHSNPGRQPLFDAVYRVAADQFEHDIYYADLRDWWVEEIFKSTLRGEWQPRLHCHPDPRWWKEPEPYGGKRSIVYKMWLHRDEIKRILEEA